MAYTAYTPNASTAAELDDDIDLPDDSELESAGVGAFDSPLEDLADRIAKAKNLVAVSKSYYGNAGSVVFSNLNSTAVKTVQSGGSDADHVVSGVLDGDDILVSVVFFLQTTAGAACDLRLECTGVGSHTVHTLTSTANSYYMIVMQGVVTATADGNAKLFVTLENDAAGAGVGTQVVGEMMWTTTRVRA